MSEISTAVQAAIAGNLPAAVADELQKFIAQAKSDASALAMARKEIENMQAREEKLRAQVADQAEIEKREKALADESAKLRKRELDLEVAMAKNVAAVAVAEKDATLSVVGLFLKNTTVRTNVVSSVGVPVEGSPGSPQHGIYPTSGTVVQSHDSRVTIVEHE
jgi:hypothetical protein